MRKLGPVLGIFALVLLAGLVALSFVPRRGRPNVAIALLGYTNDVSENRMARIGVTNLSSFKVKVYLPIIQVQSPDDRLGFTNYFPGNTNQWRQFHAYLRKGESGSFTISPPPLSSQSAWRLSFFAYCDYELVQVIKNCISRRWHPYRIESGWFVDGIPQPPTAN
jgi:hypothetical protein